MGKVTKRKLVEVLKPFFEVNGFEARSDSRGIYLCRNINPSEVNYIDIELSTDLDFILQRSFNQGEPEQISLSDFRGIPSYEISSPYNNFIDEIVEDFNSYGIPWLSGEEVNTEYLEASKKQAEEYKFNGLVDKAKQAFKSKDYEMSNNFYIKASEIKVLTGTHLATHKIVKKKTS